MPKNNLTSRIIKFEQRLPLERFLTAVFIITVLLLCAISIVTYNNAEKSQENAKVVSHTYQIMANLNAVVISVRDAASKVSAETQGFDKTILNTRDYQNQTNKIIAELRLLMLNNNEQLKNLEILDAVTSQRYMLLNKSLEEYIKSPKNKAVQNQLSNAGRILSDSVRNITKYMVEKEEQLLKARGIESESSNTYSKFFIIITSLIGFSVVGFSLYLTRRLIGLRNDAYSELQTSYDILEDKVEERTLELKKSNEVLSEEIFNRNKAESAVKEKEERFQKMADSAPVLIWIANTNKERTYFNKSWFDFTGRTLGEELGSGWRKGIHPEDVERYLHTYESSFEKRKSFEIEYRMRSANGDYKWLLNKASPRYEGKVFAGFIGSCVDITQRKITERHINIQHRVMRSLALPHTLEEGLKNTLKEICVELKWDYGVVRDTLSGNKIIGVYYNGEVSSSDIYDSESFIAKEILKKCKALWADNLDKNIEAKESFEVNKLNYKTVLAFPATDGESITAIFECYNKYSFYPKQDLLDIFTSLGRQIGIFIERKKAENEIKQMNELLSEKVNERTKELQKTLTELEKEIVNRIENESKLNEAQQIAHLGNWEWNINEDIITWSNELYNIFGITKGNKPPKFEEYISYIHPEDRDLVKETVSYTLKTGSSFNYFHRIITPQGITKTLNSQGQAVIDSAGKIIRMYGIALDVTDLKHAEEELRETYNKLQITQRELVHKEKLAALGRFSSGIAHEIRNPLANISALAQILNKSPLDDKLKKHLKYILINSDIANKIIKDLLNFASPEELSLIPESITAILDDVCESVETRCQQKKIKLIKSIGKNIPPIQLDKKKLNLAFMNFVSNAIDAMSEGGSLTIAAETDKKSNEVVLKFTDTGMGIPKDNFDKILEPFFTTKDEGTGLGMGLAYQVIKSHFGNLSIESEEGVGTTVEVRLPITKNHN